MADFTHPIGDDHPFPTVYALAQAQGFDPLELVNVYDGALIRLYTKNPQIVFKLDGDPGSAMDRQRFDYYKHVRIDPAPTADMLDTIKHHIAEHGA